MVSSHARAASPQALLFLTSLPNHKAWWPQEARVAAEMNSAALGRPWPLFQPTYRPVGTLSSPVDSQVPRHIGIIMDGNGRWARRRGRPASFGHRAGVRAIKRALQACEDLGVHTLSIYAFSTENWARPRAEVRALMRLFHETMQREIDEMHRRGVRIVVSGRREDLSPRMRERIDEAMKRTANNGNGVLNVCLNYGGRAELVDAVRSVVRDGISERDVNEAAISSRMYQPSLADPDLIIRTAGEHRVSNFLLWQGAYAEMLVSETLWPDFDAEDLKAALAEYASRVRRFGARPEAEVVAG